MAIADLKRYVEGISEFLTQVSFLDVGGLLELQEWFEEISAHPIAPLSGDACCVAAAAARFIEKLLCARLGDDGVCQAGFADEVFVPIREIAACSFDKEFVEQAVFQAIGEVSRHNRFVNTCSDIADNGWLVSVMTSRNRLIYC